jgi:hypothetical protein
MKALPSPIAAAAAATLLSACVVETPAQPAPAQPASARPAPAQPVQGGRFDPIPDVGFAPEVTGAAVDACRRRLDAETDGAVDIAASEFSQANSAVYMTVGPQRAPWRCLVSNDGVVQELMFMGEG